VAEPARPVPKFSIGDAVTYGWNACWRNFAPVMLVSLVVLAGDALTVLLSAANSSPAMNYAFSLFGALVEVLLVFGLIRAALEVVEGRTPSLAEVFRPDGYGPFLVASVLFLLGLYVGLLLLVVPGLIFGLVFQFYGFVVAEHPDAPATVALRRSAQITRGARIRLLGLSVVLLLLNLAGFVVCVVGLVVTYAISAVALAYVYRLLSGQPVASL
jgi:uncharacterized membrane protein